MLNRVIAKVSNTLTPHLRFLWVVLLGIYDRDCNQSFVEQCTAYSKSKVSCDTHIDYTKKCDVSLEAHPYPTEALTRMFARTKCNMEIISPTIFTYLGFPCA
ncbi:unnamed protein product, partial [Discosporangium mesarthrocarpum]